MFESIRKNYYQCESKKEYLYETEMKNEEGETIKKPVAKLILGALKLQLDGESRLGIQRKQKILNLVVKPKCATSICFSVEAKLNYVCKH